MPIEMWWWIMPLMKTAIVFMFTFGVLSLILAVVFHSDWVSTILFIIAALPWCALILSFVAWLMANFGVYIISIWRCAYA